MRVLSSTVRNHASIHTHCIPTVRNTPFICVTNNIVIPALRSSPPISLIHHLLSHPGPIHVLPTYNDGYMQHQPTFLLPYLHWTLRGLTFDHHYIQTTGQIQIWNLVGGYRRIHRFSDQRQIKCFSSFLDGRPAFSISMFLLILFNLLFSAMAANSLWTAIVTSIPSIPPFSSNQLSTTNTALRRTKNGLSIPSVRSY